MFPPVHLSAVFVAFACLFMEANANLIPKECLGIPTLQHRSANPDRLWLADHEKAPANSTGYFAISNDNGATAAYWYHINATLVNPELGSVHPISGTESDTLSTTLQRRLPSFINVYKDTGCSGFTAQIKTPHSGQCYSNWGFSGQKSIYLPSFEYSDIINLYTDKSCQSYTATIYAFAGCLNEYYESFWPCNVCNL